MKNIYRNKGRPQFEHWQKIAVGLMLFDALAISCSFFIALWLRYDCQFSIIPANLLQGYETYMLINIIFTESVFWAMHLYSSIWRFAGYSEVFKVCAATTISVTAHYAAMQLLICPMPFPYYAIGAMMQFALTLSIRLSYRVFLWFRNGLVHSSIYNSGNIMLIGAGEAGQLILKDIHNSPKPIGTVKCIIDDNHNKWGRFIGNVPIVGGRDTIMDSVRKYHITKIFVAIPSASPSQIRDILNICQEANCEIKNLPSITQLCNGEVSVSKMRDVSIEDLLGREPINVDNGQIFKYLVNKTVLITGASGSIGSELSRQIAANNPKILILFDIYENTTYSLQLELRAAFPNLHLVTLIGSVRDSRKLDEVFATYKPEVVFHAAAHKHVPLMEDSPCEAIKNNTIGTYKTAYVAAKHGCERFVLISTDKAVNPTNIMGASKRLCEMIIQGFSAKINAGRAHEIPSLFTHETSDLDVASVLPANTNTEFVAVRFGNVLGSNGSVIPLFKAQIEKGGPVTVTHPDIIRYFMTIPEAVCLVLQAAAYANGGEIFVLDMGSPVKIDTLARNLIRLSGYTPGIDIKIEYTGLRPGEKLYEEKLMAEEGMKKTRNALIHIGSPIDFDVDEFFHQLKLLMNAAYTNSDHIKPLVASIISTYHATNDCCKEAEKISATKQQNSPSSK